MHREEFALSERVHQVLAAANSIRGFNFSSDFRLSRCCRHTRLRGPPAATTFEIDSFSYCRHRSYSASRDLSPHLGFRFPWPLKPESRFYLLFQRGIHSSSKGWHPIAGGTIALSGRFRLIESGRDKGEKKRRKGKEKFPGGVVSRRVDLSSSRGLQPRVKRKVRGTHRYKALFTPHLSLSLLSPHHFLI